MGGEHKCPLCDATFTRPQHVGRHLRSHTGDKPYACKECPLRFARSDLLSRHVNKTHRAEEEGGPPKESKKGRRKSLGSHADGQPILKPQDRARAASFSLGPHNAFRPTPQSTTTAAHNVVQAPVYSLQTLSTDYPVAGPSNYNASADPRSYQNAPPPPHLPPTFSDPFVNAGIAGPDGSSVQTEMPPPGFTGAPMSMQNSAQGSSSSSMGRNPSVGSWGSGQTELQAGPKKRACDQCNHSKVRCDFAEPCLRCSNKNFACSYTKITKPRAAANPLAALTTTAQRASLPLPLAVLNTSVSPQSTFSSPYSSVSPIMPQAGQYTATNPPPVQIQQAVRRTSAGNIPSQSQVQYASSVPTHLYNLHPSHPARQNWQLAEAQPLSNYPLTYRHETYPPITHEQPQTIIHPNLSTSSYSSVPLGQPSWSQGPQGLLSSVAPQRQLSNTTTLLSDQSSPLVPLGSTPALTSHTTSPSGLSEPEQPRATSAGPISFGQIVDAAAGQGRESSVTQPTPLQNSYDLPIVGAMPVSLDPGAYQPNYADASMWIPPPPLAAGTEASVSAPEAPLDQMYHFRTNGDPRAYDEDDATASQAGSSVNLSSFLDMDEATFQQTLEHRRRASLNGGVWATAFNNMTLHDSAGNPIPSGLPMAPGQLFTSGQYQYEQKRPTMLATAGDHATDPAGRMPSMSDVKDLWKLFMTEPITGPTPRKEKNSFLESGTAALPIQTPRPGMGLRTLSKSNSMPDLTSPLLGNHTFFSNYYNPLAPRLGDGGFGGTTPMPVPSHGARVAGRAAPEEGDGKETAVADDVSNEWKKEIKQRQASFNMSMQHPGINGKRGKTGASSSLSPAEFPFDQSQPQAQPPASAPSPSFPDYALLPTSSAPALGPDPVARPIASVFKRNQALDQTLGPERAPSFGIHGQFDLGGGITPTSATFPRIMSQYQQQLSNLHHQTPVQVRQPSHLAPAQMYANYTHTQQPGGKVTSASARPGNKRLASQTLTGADGKRASFSMFDGEDEGDEEGEGAAGMYGESTFGVGTGGAGLGSGSLAVPVGWQSTNA